MLTRRYAVLSLVPLAMLFLGLVVMGTPEPFRGPRIDVPSLPPGSLFGLALLARPLYLTDALGLTLLVLATLEIWVIALAWEYSRHRR
jgi:hypothetical protein